MALNEYVLAVQEAEHDMIKTLDALDQCGEEALTAQRRVERQREAWQSLVNQTLLEAHKEGAIDGKNAEIRKLQTKSILETLQESGVYKALEAREEDIETERLNLQVASQAHSMAKRIHGGRETILKYLTA